MGIANSATIGAELIITDKGSAVISGVARSTQTAFSLMSRAARSAGSVIYSAFDRAISRVTGFITHLFSLRNILLLLSGAGVVALFSRTMGALGERSESLATRFVAIRDAIGGFIGRVVDYIGKNPALLRMLDTLAYKITEWAQRLPEFEGKIRGIVNWTVDFVTGALPRAFEFLSTIWATVKDIVDGIWKKIQSFIAWVQSAWAKVDSFISRVSGFLGGGSAGTPSGVVDTMHGGSDGSETGAGETTGGMRPFMGGVGTTVNNYFTQNMSRSDAVAIATETERQAYRDGE